MKDGRLRDLVIDSLSACEKLQFKNATLLADCQDYSDLDYTGARDKDNPQSQHTTTKSTTNNKKKNGTS